MKDYYKLKTFFLVPRNVTISSKLFEIRLKGPELDEEYLSAENKTKHLLSFFGQLIGENIYK